MSIPPPHKITKNDLHNTLSFLGDELLPTEESIGNIHYELLQGLYPDIDVPNDISPTSFTVRQYDQSQQDRASFFASFESSAPTVEADVHVAPTGSAGVPSDVLFANPPTYSTEYGVDTVESTHLTLDTAAGRRRKKEPTREEKTYRSDREFVKRRSHQKMIWFFRELNIRHPAAIRTHLERVKHTEFELPNLQCVYPHQELSIACDENTEAVGNGSDRNNKCTVKNVESVTANTSYYNLYCATTALVNRIRDKMGAPEFGDTNYNKNVVAFIADIVGRLLWHTNRTHAVMFAKSDHYDRGCFMLYSRQVEPTPFIMRSDSFFCRRHDSDRYTCIAPQPDLTRANSIRMSNESSIYVVGCDFSEIWNEFPYEYRMTQCRPMKSLCDGIKRIDSSVLNHVFSPVNSHLNGDRERSSYVEVASSVPLDYLSVLLRDPDSRRIVADDSTVHREYLERFITVAIMNVQALIGINNENEVYGGYRDTNARRPPIERLNRVVLHNVNYRREVRTLRTNRVYYYRNQNDFICSHSLIDDRFEGDHVVDGSEATTKKPVYFYDLVQPFEYDSSESGSDANHIVMRVWEDTTTMIRESAKTISHRLTPDVLRNPFPDDPFYPPSDMSAIDLAIDRMLERAIKHSKKITIPRSPTRVRRQNNNKGHVQSSFPDNRPSTDSHVGLVLDSDQNFTRNVISRSLSKIGENRLRDGYSSPTRQDYERVIKCDGREIPVRIKVGPGERPLTRVEFNAEPVVKVYERLICVYLIDPDDKVQVRIVPGAHITDPSDPSYIKLKLNDRIVRVFCVQHIQGAFVIRPFVYLVFRNMPYAEVNSNLLEQIYRDTISYEGYEGFGTIERSGGVAECTNGNVTRRHDLSTETMSNVQILNTRSTTCL